MLASWGLGWWRGRSVAVEPGDDPGTKFIDGSLGLLGLLLAFTFAIALGRYDQRRLAVIAESNALGDFYTCATLLNEPYRTKLQDLIRDYASDQLKTPHQTLEGEAEQKATQRCNKMWADMTDIVYKANANGTPIAVPLTNTLNNLISSSAARLAMYQVRLPQCGLAAPQPLLPRTLLTMSVAAEAKNRTPMDSHAFERNSLS